MADNKRRHAVPQFYLNAFADLMIVFRVQLRVSLAIRDRVVKSLLRLLGPTRAVRGCTACGTYVDIEDDAALLCTEEWETQQALDERLRTDDLKIDAPVVRFDAMSGTRGMGVIATARAGLGGVA